MSLASALSRPLAPRALRASVRPLLVAAACLTAVGMPRLLAQNPGDIDPVSFISFADNFTPYTSFIQYGTAPGPSLFVGGDSGVFDVLNLSDGSPNTNVDVLDLSAFGGPARNVYTAVPERVAPPEGNIPYVLIGGQFGRSALKGQTDLPPQGIKRLTPYAKIDPTFDVGKGANNLVTSIVPLAGGGLIAGGLFDTFNNQARQHIVRLDKNGAIVDSATFDPNLSFDASVLSIAEEINLAGGADAAPQYVVAGQFSNVNGQPHQKLVRINSDGSVDNSFQPTFDDRTVVVAAQPDGKILVGGDFSNVNGQPVKHLVRLNYDGSIDTGFVANVTVMPSGLSNPVAVYVIQLLTDGRMYIGGNFTTVNGVTRRFLARLGADGTVDPAFDPGTNLINAVQTISVSALDGKLIVGESISQSVNGVRRPTVVRLYAEPPTSLRLKAKGKRAVITPRKQGVFQIRRTNIVSTVLPYTFNVTLSGTAVTPNTNDKGNFFPLEFPGGAIGFKPDGQSYTYQVTFPAGVDVLPIGVTPRKQKNGSSNGKTVTLTLDDGQSATVTIVND